MNEWSCGFNTICMEHILCYVRFTTFDDFFKLLCFVPRMNALNFESVTELLFYFNGSSTLCTIVSITL